MTGSGSTTAAWILSLLIFTSIGSALPAFAALTSDHVAVLANRNSAESLAVARHYLTRRGVPAEHLIQLDLPLGETIHRQVYEQKMVKPIRRALISRHLATKVRVLVTTYGIPLRVQAPLPSPDRQRWRKDAGERQRFAQAYLTRIVEQLHRLAAVNAPDDSIQPMGTQPGLTSKTSEALLQRVDKAIHAAATDLQQAGDRDQHRQWTQELARIRALVGGSARKRGEAEQRRRDMTAARSMIQVLLEAASDSTRQRAYRLAQQVFGLTGILQLANQELAILSHEKGDASVDSELSLLWWDHDSYRLAGRLPNPLHGGASPRGSAGPPSIPILMVSRLDAPTPQLARRLVDQALAAERYGLMGTVYVDARGMRPDRPLGYGAYDQSLRDLASLVRRTTSYPVVLDDTQRRFSQPGEAPDVALYAGWYRLRAYEDAFTFRPGAIGYHIASGEAVSLHNLAETGWCKNALERGITATLGSTGEPYLDAFPLPSELIGLLLTGRYSLVEAYYLTTRYVSWRMVLIGDPLYNPWRGKGLGEEKDILAPSERPFADPVLARQAAGKRREAALAQIDYLFSVQGSK